MTIKSIFDIFLIYGWLNCKFKWVMKKEIRKIVEFGVNIDESIADGYYFSKSIKLLEYILNNPKLLEDNINEKIENVEIR